MLPSLHNLPLQSGAPTGANKRGNWGSYGYMHPPAADVYETWERIMDYDPNAPDFKQVAMFAIQKSYEKTGWAEAMRYVHYEHSDFYDLAIFAVDLNPDNIREVDVRNRDYMRIAKHAIERDPDVLLAKGYIKGSFLMKHNPYADYAELTAYAEKVKAEKARAMDDDDGPVYRTWEREAGRALAQQRERERSRPSSPVRGAIQKKHGNRRPGRS